MSALDLHAAGELYCPTCEKSFAAGERCPTDNTRLVRLARHADHLIGRELDGRYTIIDWIGEGGMGTVYRGKQHSVGRECAIKVVNPNLVREPVAVKRFLREAKLASRLAHPNAVAVLDFGQTDDGLFFLVMELVIGRTLHRVLEEDRELAPSRVARIGTQICDALEGAHAIDIVHRDLKPANVMIISTGRDLVKVLDFGLAKSLSPDALSNKTTNAGALLGTPAYMPPELVSGGAVDGRADLYSLGCVLYQAATGHLPFWSENVHDLVAMHVSAPLPKLTAVPRRLAQVIEKMLAKAPGDRFQSAAHAREALEAAVSMIPDTFDESPGFGSTMLGWPARGRSDTLESIEPPRHVSFGTPEPTSNPDLEPTDPGAQALRTPVNVSTAWERPAAAPAPASDHAVELADDTVRVNPAWVDGTTTPSSWPGNRQPPARGSAQVVPPPEAGKVLRIVRARADEPVARPKGTSPPQRLGSPPMQQVAKTAPPRAVSPRPAPTASTTLDMTVTARRRTLMLAMIAVGVAIVLGAVVYVMIGRDTSEPVPPPPAPAPAKVAPAPTPAPVAKPAPIVTPLPPAPPAPAAAKPEPAKPKPTPPPAKVVAPKPPPPAPPEPPAQAPSHVPGSPAAPPAETTPPPSSDPAPTEEPAGNAPP